MTAPVDSSTAAAMLGMDQAAMSQIFAYYEQTNGGDMTDPESWRISVQTIVNLLADDTNMSAALTAGQKAQMQNLKSVINLSVSGRKLNASQMSSALGMKSDDVRQIFILNTYKNEGTSSWKMSPHKFVGFLVSDVLTDKSMRKKMGGSAEELRMLNSIISSVVAGRTYSAKQLSDFLGAYSDRMDSSSINMLYKYYGSINSYDESWEMNLVEFVHHLDDKIISNEAYSDLIDEEMTSNVGEMRTQLDDNVALLKGEEYGRMIISAKLDVDSDDTREFFGKLTDRLDDSLNKDYYLIGSSAMAYEMSCTFKDELNRITLITALLILLVVLITFRRLAAPVILVLIIQSAVFATMAIMSFANYDMNYLALLIVQSIMMGATIDYAIIYTSYYVEVRERHMPQAALTEAFRGSFHTILTSATILFVAVGILSFAFKEEATRQICRILSLGCLIATLLVILILPAVLACCDRFVAGRDAVSDQSSEEEI
ncbi:MAG: MMPL family transporter, partial [Lentihominibacter sp.]|nr:MMPL family transporter [Lentihominibacter sp.]